jgi:hypothetical protein
VILSRRQVKMQRMPVLIAKQVNLGGESAARAA